MPTPEVSLEYVSVDIVGDSIALCDYLRDVLAVTHIARSRHARTTAATSPRKAVEQITALKQLAVQQPISVEPATKAFSGATRDVVARHIETVALLGGLRVSADGSYAIGSLRY